MKLKDLHTSLSNLQEKLDSFSFNELSVKQADALRGVLNNFKKLLVHKSNVKATFSSENNSFKDKLITRANSEIKKPLHGILNNTEKLLKSNLTMEQEKIVKDIQVTSSTMLNVSEDLIGYTTSNDINENLSIPIKFKNVVNDVLFLCNTLITTDNLVLNKKIDSDIPKQLIGDPSKLSQILLNIVGNSIQSTAKGEILVTASVKENYTDNVILEFNVNDTNGTITDKKALEIFDIYRQDNSKLGLGLNVAKELIESLNGTIYVSNRESVGTTFTFTIPFKKPLKPLTATNIASVSGINVLVFEDNKLNQKLLEFKLDKWQCTSFVTDNCSTGLEILENNIIDIILMDMRMPEKNGDEIAEIIKSHTNARISNTPIIAVTADDDIQNSKEFNTSNFTNFLLKPYTSEELLNTLLEQLQKNANMETLTSNHINDHGDTRKLNLTPVLNECMGDLGMLQELVKLFKNNALEFIGKSIVHIKNEDFEALKFATHKIKAGLKMMKTDALFESVLQMENAIKDDVDVKHLNFLYNCFIDEYPVIEQQLDDELLRLAEEA
ncbi:response regulator [Cellulophaga omnivescoria]|uniref:response regulator n=1 Tax=Cellulophaga omnivescoria TaxID=1888890 RepID=UPI0011155FCB|nr:response regulator [Cellulophaga omnivescoria]